MRSREYKTFMKAQNDCRTTNQVHHNVEARFIVVFVTPVGRRTTRVPNVCRRGRMKKRLHEKLLAHLYWSIRSMNTRLRGTEL